MVISGTAKTETDELAQKSFNDFLKDTKISLASYPKIDFKNLEKEQSDFEIIYDFEILPEIPELNYTEIDIMIENLCCM